MTQSIIDIGDAPNDGTGDPVREAFNKCNNNFTELYTTGSGAPLNSPAFTGNPTAPTPTAGDNDTSIATTAFVTAAVAAGSSADGAGPPQGRLTLQTGTPVMTTTQSAKTTIYYTPYVGNQVPIYDGTNMVMTTFAELSVATTDTTKSPAAIGVSKVNDWFVWSDAGTVRIGHGPDWTSDTARSAGTALVMVNGIWLNNVSITNGPAASRGTYVGTTRSNASSQLDWIFGAVAAGGTAGWFGVWNMYNREQVASMTGDTVASYTYSTAAWRSANASNLMRCSFVVGLDISTIYGTYISQAYSNTTSGVAAVGVGFDSTAAYSRTTGAFYFSTTATVMTTAVAETNIFPGIGFHFVQAIEYGASGVTFVGQVSPQQQSGLSFVFRM